MARKTLAPVLRVLFLFALTLSPSAVAVPENEKKAAIHFVENATARGAVCLDGSPAAYLLNRGFGQGTSNWLVYLSPGGLCHDAAECLNRSREARGSTRNITNQPVSGILDTKFINNPDLFHWNHVRVWYCDGGAYMGDVDDVDPSTNLHFRGARIFSAIVEELLEKGLRGADNVMLTGCSAGALGTILHCDRFRYMLPSGTTVKCVADAGYFVNVKDIFGLPYVAAYMDELVNLHGMLKNLDPLCREEMRKRKKKESLCIFPENMALHINTPIFFINAQYDFVQIRVELVPSPPDASWDRCRYDITQCSPEKVQIIQDFRGEFLDIFSKGAGASPSRGYFVNGCFDHCQTDTQERWLGEDSPRIKGTPVAKAVGDWYFERNSFKEIGIPYPHDQSCQNHKG